MRYATIAVRRVPPQDSMIQVDDIEVLLVELIVDIFVVVEVFHEHNVVMEEICGLSDAGRLNSGAVSASATGLVWKTLLGEHIPDDLLISNDLIGVVKALDHVAINCLLRTRSVIFWWGWRAIDGFGCRVHHYRRWLIQLFIALDR